MPPTSPRMVKLSTLKPHTKNPRKITGPKFEALKKSLTDFPEMMELQPFIVDEKNILLRGNMRREALLELGRTEVPASWVKKASDLTAEQKDKFMLLDNDHYGEWDYDVLAKDWNLSDLANWNLSMPKMGQAATLTSTKTAPNKGTIVRVKCKNNEDAKALFTRLLAEGHEVELK